MRFPVRMFISTLAVMVTSYLLPGVMLDSFLTALVTALLIALLNTVLKPLLILFTIPLTIVTFGLFLLVINASIIMMASHLLRGFHVNGFWYALLFSIILSGITAVMESLVSSDSKPLT
jgi:putative membrane protein